MNKLNAKLLILIIVMILVQGCSGELGRERIQLGENMCKNNGGLETITFDVSLVTGNVQVHCKDGLHAKIPYPEDVKEEE